MMTGLLALVLMLSVHTCANCLVFVSVGNVSMGELCEGVPQQHHISDADECCHHHLRQLPQKEGLDGDTVIHTLAASN